MVRIMKTTIDLVNILYELINVPAVKSLINGGVYKNERPVNSSLQDVVIGSTTVDNEAFQNGVGYINIHHPGPMPGHLFFKNASEAIIPLVKAHYERNEYHLLVTNVAGPMRQMDGDGFVFTIRIRATLYYN